MLGPMLSGGAGGAFSTYLWLSSIFDLSGPSLEFGTGTDIGFGLSGGFSVTLQRSSSGDPTGGANGYVGVAGSCPPMPSGGAQGCSTTVDPIGWDIYGPSGGGVPFPS